MTSMTTNQTSQPAEPWATLEIQSELRLDRPLAVGRLAVGHTEAGNEIDEERGNADDEDKEGTGFAHRRRMIHGTAP